MARWNTAANHGGGVHDRIEAPSQFAATFCFGIGFVSAVIILYMSEIAPKRFRGAIVSGYQFCITIGLLLAAVVDNRTQHRMDSGSYRIPMSLQWLFALVLGVGLFLLPESPRWYIKKGRNTDAARALATLRGQSPNSDYVNDELKELVANHEYEMRTMRAGWGDCFTGGWKPSSNLRRVVLGMALQMMQQWTGVNFNLSSLIGTMLTERLPRVHDYNRCERWFHTHFFLAIEKFGRRPLLIFGAIGMLICEFIIAIVGTVAEGSKAAGIVLIVFTCIYIFFFASTWGPGAWVLIGEIFPLPIRAKGVALSTASNWFWNFVISFITPYMVDQEYGNLKARVFFVWGATCTLCVVFAYFLVPETKGLSLEQVDHMLEETTPRNSAKWVPHSRRRDGADVFSFDTTEKKGDLKAGEHREHGVVV
ncbi:high affinity glucose transporter RGT2 [Pyrenophora tritici-repentis Pt-1C-BFP]|uniref:High affinity glucose transporter RGT2 n=1 Tax=Pyrenophora tritici-repentis (strain Pt-1C-BFP) TaxID=426418 RepID=B2VRY3_PYRTR|nr:high affinity glucose transporter RGT2 [Pyrenophora tritici-repentis Pt-1C-BFP]EDU39757.1 high affinity glucose transporter RGT2 [Pyrenophora tritici-repentis Pt-1C-BFP]